MQKVFFGQIIKMNILVIILFLLSIAMTDNKTGWDNLIIHNNTIFR